MAYSLLMMKMTQKNYEEFLKNGTAFSLDPSHLLIGWGARKWSATPLNGTDPDFYFPDFFLMINTPWFTQENWMIIAIDEFKALIPEIKESIQAEWRFKKQPFFESKFLELETKIKEGELTKAVPYLFLHTDKKMDVDAFQSKLFSLCNYIQRYEAFLYGLWNYEEGVLGATPEILFKSHQVNKKIINFETVACAGTYPSDKEHLLCHKLQLEHDIVIEGIKSSFNSLGAVISGPLKTATFASITHLMTTLDVTLFKALTFDQIVRALHPTPALGAYPKDKGMVFLEKYQMGIPRGRFGAPVGFMFNDYAHCFVAIRNIQWEKRGMQIGAGCGVCAGSTLDSELNEIKLKLNAILNLLGIHLKNTIEAT